MRESKQMVIAVYAALVLIAGCSTPPPSAPATEPSWPTLAMPGDEPTGTLEQQMRWWPWNPPTAADAQIAADRALPLLRAVAEADPSGVTIAGLLNQLGLPNRDGMFWAFASSGPDLWTTQPADTLATRFRWFITVDTPDDTLRCRFFGVACDTNYTVTVQAWNAAGGSKLSVPGRCE